MKRAPLDRIGVRRRVASPLGLVLLLFLSLPGGDAHSQPRRAGGYRVLPPVGNLEIAGGVSGDRRLLSVPSDGTFSDLWRVDDDSGRQRWHFVRSADGETMNIVIDGGVAGDRRYLSVTGDGTRVDLWKVDDGSGRQRWIAETVDGRLLRFRIAGGVSGERRYLSVTPDGTKVDLWTADDGSGRQRWKVRSLRPRWSRSANIAIGGGVAGGRRLLSVPGDGTFADLWGVDDGSGRQQWDFALAPDGASYNILLRGGVEPKSKRYLSVTADGTKVDLFGVDDGSGRQRWLFEELEGGLYRIRIAGGVSGDRAYLSVTGDGRKVDLWKVDDGSGRQRWSITSR